jgi:hypothetical protein
MLGGMLPQEILNLRDCFWWLLRPGFQDWGEALSTGSASPHHLIVKIQDGGVSPPVQSMKLKIINLIISHRLK